MNRQRLGELAGDAKPEIHSKDAPSREFEDAFSDHCGSCVQDCACGRTCFDVVNTYDWEAGELDRLEEARVRDPGRYVALEYACCGLTVNGKTFIMGCPCNGGEPYERFLVNHAEQIAKFLNKRAELLKAHATASEVML